jgi:hypothetical protein
MRYTAAFKNDHASCDSDSILYSQDSDIAIGAFRAQQPGEVRPVAEIVPYEDTKIVDADKFLTAFDHTNNMTYVMVTPSNATLPFLAIWPGYGSDVHVVPKLDEQLRQLVSIDYIPSHGLIATNSTHILKIDPDTGSFEAITQLSDHGLQNGGHTTTDGQYLYVHLHDGEQYWIGTVNFSAVPVSVTLSVPASMDDHILVAMHWSFKYNCIVAMRTADGIFVAMQVGNQSSVNASDFQKVREITGPHYTDCGLPQGNSATFVSGDYWYAALKCSPSGANEQGNYLTFIDMPSWNPKVIEENNFDTMYLRPRSRLTHVLPSSYSILCNCMSQVGIHRRISSVKQPTPLSASLFAETSNCVRTIFQVNRGG